MLKHTLPDAQCAIREAQATLQTISRPLQTTSYALLLVANTHASPFDSAETGIFRSTIAPLSAYQQDTSPYLDTLSPLYVSNNGLTVTQHALQARGLGQTSFSASYQSPVSLFINNQQRNTRSIQLLDLVDIASAEWASPANLESRPIGIGGSLTITSSPPEPGVHRLTTTSNVERFSSRRIVSIWNHGFSDDVSAMRIAASYRESIGSVSSADDPITEDAQADSNHRERVALRGQYLLTPNDNVHFYFNSDYNKTLENCCSVGILADNTNLRSPTPLGSSSYFAAIGLPNDGGAPNTGTPAFDNRLSNNSQNTVRLESANFSLTTKISFENTYITYTPAYSEYSSKTRRTTDFTTLDITNIQSSSGTTGSGDIFDQRTTNHHFKFHNDANEAVYWEIGFHYTKDKTDRTLTTVLGADYQAYSSASLLSALDAIGLQSISEGLFTNITDFYSSFSGVFPSLNPLTSTNLALTATSSTPSKINANGNFASNQFTEDRSVTSMYLRNAYRLAPGVKLAWSLRSNIEKADTDFSQLASNSTACIGTLTNPDLQNLQVESQNASNSLQVNAGYAALYNTLQATACPFDATAASTIDIDGDAISEAFSTFHKSTHWSGNLALTVDISPQTRSWIKLSNKTKSGGVNLHPSANALNMGRFKEETHDIYEVGLAASINNELNSRVQLTLFHHDIKNLQTEAPYPASTGNARLRGMIINLDKAMTSGLHLSGESTIYGRLSGKIGYSYVDARSAANCSANIATLDTTTLCDRKISLTPENKAHLSLKYKGEWNTSTDWTLQTDFLYESARDLGETIGFSEDIDLTLEQTLTTNLSLTLSGKNNFWSVSIYGKNITDEQTGRQVFNIPNRPGAVAAYFDEPKQYGVSFTLRLEPEADK